MKTDNITQLFEAGFELARLRRDGLYEGCKTKKRATHLLSETKVSVVASPLKRWPKHKSKHSGYGKPRYNKMNVPADHSEILSQIPPQATHCEYSTSRVAIVASIDSVNDFVNMRGRLRFGRYRPATDRFEAMDADGRPLEEGTVSMNAEHRTMQQVVRQPDLPAAPKLPKPPKFKPGAQAPAAAAKAQPKPPAQKARIPRPAGGESVCGYIDSLIVEGGRTKEEILALVMKKFPDRNPKSTLSTIAVRPTHIRKAGKTPKPFKK